MPYIAFAGSILVTIVLVARAVSVARPARQRSR